MVWIFLGVAPVISQSDDRQQVADRTGHLRRTRDHQLDQFSRWSGIQRRAGRPRCAHDHSGCHLGEMLWRCDHRLSAPSGSTDEGGDCLPRGPDELCSALVQCLQTVLPIVGDGHQPADLSLQHLGRLRRRAGHHQPVHFHHPPDLHGWCELRKHRTWGRGCVAALLVSGNPESQR